MKDEEIEFDCLWYIKSKDTFKKEHPRKNIDIDEYYNDKSIRNFSFGDRKIMSAYTSHGIKEIESWFCKQIQNESKFTNKELEKMIRRNPHLHNVIKTNLLDNLSRKF